MALTVRAIYEDGQFRPLEDVALADGQEVSITILSDRDLIRAALGDLIVKFPDPPRDDDDFDEEALQREVDAELSESPRLSDAVIEERREGP